MVHLTLGQAFPKNMEPPALDQDLRKSMELPKQDLAYPNNTVPPMPGQAYLRNTERLMPVPVSAKNTAHQARGRLIPTPQPSPCRLHMVPQTFVPLPHRNTVPHLKEASDLKATKALPKNMAHQAPAAAAAAATTPFLSNTARLQPVRLTLRVIVVLPLNPLSVLEAFPNLTEPHEAAPLSPTEPLHPVPSQAHMALPPQEILTLIPKVLARFLNLTECPTKGLRLTATLPQNLGASLRSMEHQRADQT
jgi:hypothetical protein